MKDYPETRRKAAKIRRGGFLDFVLIKKKLEKNISGQELRRILYESKNNLRKIIMIYKKSGQEPQRVSGGFQRVSG